MNDFTPGQALETTVAAVSDSYIFLDLNAKTEGVLDAAEFKDACGNLTVKKGDVIKAFFLEEKDGELRFTTKITAEKNSERFFSAAYESGIPVEGRVVREIKGGYEIKIGANRAFCPYSHMGSKRRAAPEEYIGKTLQFKILEYKENGRNTLVSNRAIDEQAQADLLIKLKSSLREGDTVSGSVLSVEDFGAFVDIGGIDALLPASEISLGRVNNAREYLAPGQKITAEVTKIDWSKKRVTLSMKALLSDPWALAAEKYQPGTRCEGVVASIARYGAFVTLEPGIDGLLHISDAAPDQKNPSAGSLFKLGETISVVVKDLDADKRRVSLKSASFADEEESAQKYMSAQNDGGETYNPFSALFKKNSG